MSIGKQNKCCFSLFELFINYKSCTSDNNGELNEPAFSEDFVVFECVWVAGGE